MNIDWENAPEGTTHYDPSDDYQNPLNRWIRYDDLEGWCSYDEDGWDNCYTHNKHLFIPRPKFEASIPEGVITVNKIQELCKITGLEVDIYPDGDYCIWDEACERSCRTKSIDEVMELLNAAREYISVREKFTWE